MPRPRLRAGAPVRKMFEVIAILGREPGLGFTVRRFPASSQKVFDVRVSNESGEGGEVSGRQVTDHRLEQLIRSGPGNRDPAAVVALDAPATKVLSEKGDRGFVRDSNGDLRGPVGFAPVTEDSNHAFSVIGRPVALQYSFIHARSGSLPWASETISKTP